jgi:hypothetical protein
VSETFPFHSQSTVTKLNDGEALTKGSANRDSFTRSQKSRSGMTSDDYLAGAWLVEGFSFIAIWIYATASWGKASAR